MLKKISFFVVVSFALFSCSKDKNDDTSTDYQFANETVDQGKANLQSNGIDLITEMDSLQSSNGVPALQSLSEFLDENNPFESEISSIPVLKTILATASLGDDKNNISTLSQAMQSDVESDSTISQVWKSLMGIYTWDKTNKVWVKTSSSTTFQFIFPSTKTGTSNNATLTLSYTGKSGHSLIEDYNGDLPATFSASLKVSSTELFALNFNASYNTDGTPSSVDYSLTLGSFKYSMNYTYTTSDVTYKIQLTHNSNTVIEFYTSVNGNLSKTNVENADDAVAVINNANAYFQILNVKLIGSIDYKSIYNAEEQIDNDYTNELKADTARAEAYNKYFSLILVYANNNQKIAGTEFYPVVDKYTYYSGTTLYTGYESEVELRFIFKDGSKQDFETYFNTGFESIISKFSTFVSKLEAKYN
jgi:hypothetical protein